VLVGTAVKVDLLLFGVGFGSLAGAVGPRSGSRCSARSVARMNDLEADEGPPHSWSAEGWRWFGIQVLCFVLGVVGGHVCVAGAQPYLGPRTRSGDMMMDGVPGVRAWEKGAAAQSQQEVHPACGWPRAGSGSRPQASVD
jgi:hypothetical protein